MEQDDLIEAYEVEEESVDKEVDEYDDFYAQEEPQYEMSYAQREQIGFGDPGLTVTGQGRLQKIIQQQTTSKEDLYVQKLAIELSNYFSSPNDVSAYTALVRKIPRFWYKNIDTLAGVLYMYNALQGEPLTPVILNKYADRIHTRKEDIVRYYRLLSRYIKNVF